MFYVMLEWIQSFRAPQLGITYCDNIVHSHLWATSNHYVLGVSNFMVYYNSRSLEFAYFEFAHTSKYTERQFTSSDIIFLNVSFDKKIFCYRNVQE